MNIRLTRLEQTADLADLQFVGTMDGDNGQYFSCYLTLTAEDLEDGRTFDDYSKDQLLEVAKNKLAGYLK